MDRYLWAVGSAAVELPVGEQVADRYQVVAPQIWQDMQPELPPDFPEQLNGHILPYLRLYPHYLHVPEVYGICQLPQQRNFLSTPGQDVVILLENAPIDANGNLYPSMESMWTSATAVRQVYWLWQIWELWIPLSELGVASSLLVPTNLRVEGWRLRLRELYRDTMADTSVSPVVPSNGLEDRGFDTLVSRDSPAEATSVSEPSVNASLKQLGECWEAWCRKASVSVADPLQAIAQHLQTENPSLSAIASQLNHLLLEQAAQQPLRLQIAGITATGSSHSHNEDSCYPTKADLIKDPEQPQDPLIPHLSIICDGIGGHEGGEIASQLALQSIKLQVRALLAELNEDPELMTPELVTENLSAIIRVANNMISSRNDQQERESRRRMATTLTLALQLPQMVNTPEGKTNGHEIYIASVGDSRAYWLTPDYCQQLTVDDDVATREVKLGRSLYRQALQRSDAQALTQALGTKEAELLRPTVQRFLLEEDGLLLLCSDGLSNNNLIEKFGRDLPEKVNSHRLSVEAAAESLIDLAFKHNGQDDISVVLTHCAVSPQYPTVLNLGDISSSKELQVVNLEQQTALTSSLPAEITTTNDNKPETTRSYRDWIRALFGLLGVVGILVGAGAILLATQWVLAPEGFQKMRDRFLRSPEPNLPESSPTDQELPDN